jgi:uncharacterized membrane protein YqjE
MTSVKVEGPPSIGELLAGLANDVQQLIRGEIALGRAELDEKLHRVLRSAIWLLGGALLGFAGLVLLLEGVAGILAISIPIPAWAAALIVGAVIILIGVALAWSGMAAVSLKNLAPDRTVENLQKDVQIVKEHAR